MLALELGQPLIAPAEIVQFAPERIALRRGRPRASARTSASARSSSARRSSTCCSRAGDASMPSAYRRRNIASSSSCDLIAVARLQVRLRTADRASPAPPTRRQTRSKRRENGIVALIERRVAFGTQALDPLGARQHLSQSRRQLVVFAGPQRGDDPSSASWNATSSCRAPRSATRTAQFGPASSARTAHRVVRRRRLRAERHRGRRTHRARQDAWRDRAASDVRAGREARRGGPTDP